MLILLSRRVVAILGESRGRRQKSADQPENRRGVTAERGTHVAQGGPGEVGVSLPQRLCGLEDYMLETIAIILIVLWLLGVVSGYTMGNFIYVLLVIAIVLFLVRLISGRRVV
jgi:Family of unknown function (DUF5670)